MSFNRIGTYSIVSGFTCSFKKICNVQCLCEFGDGDCSDISRAGMENADTGDIGIDNRRICGGVDADRICSNSSLVCL